MSTDEPNFEPEPETGLSRALERWKATPAREEFRAKLREQFLAAPFEARVDGEGLESEPEIHVDEPLRPDFSFERRRAAARTGGRRHWSGIAALAAIAALLLIVMRWPGANAWSVAPSSTFTQVLIDGREFRPAQGEQLSAALASGSRVEVEGGTLELAFGERLALGLAPGTSLRLSAWPARDAPAAFSLRQERGSLAIATGPRFAGCELRVQTPDALVHVLGTQFVIDVEPGAGTCVCCREGAVEVRAAGLPAFEVPGGRMGFVFEDGKDPIKGQGIEAHLAPIESLRRLWGERR